LVFSFVELPEAQLASFDPGQQGQIVVTKFGLGFPVECHDPIVPPLQDPKPPWLTIVTRVIGEVRIVTDPKVIPQELLLQVRPEVSQEISVSP
jgi:hypothetical protein